MLSDFVVSTETTPKLPSRRALERFWWPALRKGLGAPCRPFGWSPRRPEPQQTTLLPDGAGNWHVGEIRRTTTRQEGGNRSTEEQVSLPDSEGKLGEVSRTVRNEAAPDSGEKRNTVEKVETYSVSVPGSVGDGSLHLVERATTAQRSSSTGQQTTEQQVEQADPGDLRF